MRRVLFVLMLLVPMFSSFLFADLQYLTKTEVAETSLENPTANNWDASDDASIQVDIGFSFPFNGTAYSQVWINSNGMISFNSSNTEYNNQTLPRSAEPQSIYPYWDDLYRRSGTIKYETYGTAPNRYFIINWSNVKHYSNSGNYTFEVVLYEDGAIRLRYDASSDADGTSYDGSDPGATIGVQENTTNYDQHSYNAGIDQTKDVLYFPTNISGHVYEEPDGDSQPGGDEVLKPGATVYLYRDSDTSAVYKMTTTDANGYYRFDNIFANEVYWVAVDSKTIQPEQSFTGGSDQGDVWAEQTYGSPGAQCADGSGGTITRASAGSCFGGKDGAVSDDATSYNTSEHLIRVDTNGHSDNEDNDFTFSFNVVTSIRDGDDDGSADRTVQGSLRQFIQNANALDGANVMRFVPSVAKNESNWWRITLSSALPQLSDSQTTIDGMAYSLNDGISIDNSNSGTQAMSNHIVGAGTDASENSGDEEHLPIYENKELEIDGGGTTNIFDCTQGSITVEDVAIYHGDTALKMNDSSDDNTFQRLYLGVRADGSDPGGGNYLSRAEYSSSGASNERLLNNYIAYVSSTAVHLSGTGEIHGNYLYHNATSNTNNDAITTEGNSAKRSVILRNNYIDGARGYGIESWSSGGGFTIEHNTIINTGADGVENGGIRIFGSESTLAYNVIKSAQGAGIALAKTGNKNIIKHNVIYGNGGLSIDLDQTHTSGNPNGDGVSANNGTTDSAKQNDDMDYPVITVATYDGNTLHIEGYVGSSAGQSAFGNADLEIYKADEHANIEGDIVEGDGANVRHGEGKEFLFDTCHTDGSGNFVCDYTVSGLATTTKLTGTATLNSYGTSEFGANKVISFLPDMHIIKTSCVIDDPVNTTNPKRIPGATIRYAIEVSNTGLGQAQNVKVEDNISNYFDASTITNLQIDGSHACNCSSPTSPGSNGNNGGVSDNIVTLDYDTVNASTTECGYFEVKIE